MSRRLEVIHAGGTFHLDPFRAVGAGPLKQLDSQWVEVRTHLRWLGAHFIERRPGSLPALTQVKLRDEREPLAAARQRLAAIVEDSDPQVAVALRRGFPNSWERGAARGERAAVLDALLRQDALDEKRLATVSCAPCALTSFLYFEEHLLEIDNAISH
ncbi:MAG: hypothetical protein JNM58_18685 [Xanthomonadaceae bacterium]|nr:hypothetical protein [Xanthomonadaceae bacterium]